MPLTLTYQQKQEARNKQAKQAALNNAQYYTQQDNQQKQEKYNAYTALQKDPNSKYYNKYASPTNQAVGNLIDLGFDISVLSDDWFNDRQNRDWISNNLEYRSGSTNTPSAPNKKSTLAQRTAYELYQYDKSREQTNQVLQQCQDAMNEAMFLAGNNGWNYSDDAIIKQIRGVDENGNVDNSNLKKKYPLLAKLESNDLSPLELNSGVNFSDDMLLGAAWAARNNGGTGNAVMNAVNYITGEGNMYSENPESTAKLEPLNPDGSINADYHPYSVGSTIAYDDALFFGIYGADDQWIEDNKRLKYYGTDEEKKHYANIEASVTNQHATDAAEKGIYDYANYLINNSSSLADVQDKLDTALATGKLYVKTDSNGNVRYSTKAKNGYEEIDLSILNRIDASVGKNIGKDNQTDPSADLVPLSIGTNYKYDNLMGKITDWFDANAQQQNDTETTNTMADDINNGYPHSTNPTSQPTLDETVSVKPALKKPADKQKTVIPKMTDAEIAQEKAANQKIREASVVVDDVATDNESTVMKNAGSVAFDANKVRFGLIRKDAVANQHFADALVNVSSKKMINEGLDKAHSIAEYSTVESNYKVDQARYDQLKNKYGDLEYLQKEFQPEIATKIGDFNVIFRFNNSGEGEYGYQIVDINSPERGATYDMILESDFAQDIIDQANTYAKEQTNEAIKIMAAHNVANARGEEGRNEVEEYKNLSKTIYDEEEYLSNNKDSNEKNIAALRKTVEQMEIQYDAMMKQGLDASGIKEAYNFMTDMLNYHDEPQLPVMNMGKLEYINEMEKTYGQSYTTEEKSAMLHQGIDQINEQIDKINADKAYMEKTGAQVPDRYVRNMEYKLADLEAVKKAYEYSAILTDTDPEELEKAISYGLAFENKYGADMQTWQGLFGSDEENPEYYMTLGKKTTAMTNDDHARYKFITDDDRRVYYYLLGKKVQELGGDNLDDLLNDTSFGGGLYQSKDLITNILKDADDFVEFMNDKDYGIWTTKRAESTEQEAQDDVNRNFRSGFAANVASTLITPIESIANAGYAFDRLLTGNGRINPNAPARIASIYKESTRAETRKSIDEYFKDNPTMKYIADLGYEIYCNRGDSLMNSMFFGMFLPEGGSSILNEFTGAAPMGISAAMNAASEAVENGASSEQAWAIFGITFLAETATEAITFSNIREAFGVTEELTKDSLKQFTIDWLTKSGIQEMIGETTNDIVENWADRMVTKWFDNPNYESEHQKRVDSYYAQGFTGEGEAEAKALEEEMKGYIHTAFVSYLSEGTDVAIKTYQAAKNTVRTAADVVNGFRRYTKADQKLGGSNSTIANLRNSLMNQNTGIRPVTGSTNTRASTQEAGTAVPSETAPVTAEQRYNNAEQALNTANEAYTAAKADYDTAYTDERRKRKALTEAKKNLTKAEKSGNQDQIAISQEKVNTAQQEYDAAKAAKEEARTRRNEASDAVTSARTESEAAAEAYEAEKATPEQKQAAADVTALGRVDGGAQTAQTEMIASILDDGEGDAAVSDQANAAATFMPTVMGEDSIFVIQQVITGASRMGIAQSVVKTALQNAALGNGAATAVVQSEAFRNATAEEKAQMLAETVEQDQNNPDVQQNIAERINDFRNGMVINDLAAHGHFDQANEAQKKANAAAKETAKAETQLQEKQDALSAATEDVEQKAQAVAENASDDNTKQHTDAVTRADNADESKKQYEEHLAKQQEAQKQAEAEAQKAKEDAMASARETAEQARTQQNQQRANEAAEKAEQQRQQEEADRKAQAQQDEMTGKADEDRRAALIEEALDRENLQGEKRETRREQLKKQLDKVKIKITDLGKSVSNTEGRLALYAFERKLGVPIVFDDLGPVNSKHITRGQYVYNEKTGEAKIVINENLIKAGKMTVGQAIVEAALHEVLHSVRATGAYNTYRHVVTEALYGNKSNLDPTELYKQNIIYRAAIDDMIADRKAAGDKNFQDNVPLEEKINKADEEIVADFARLNLADKDVVQRFMDAGMGGRMRNTLHNINQALKNYGEKLTGKQYQQWKAQTEQKNREIEQWNAEHPDQQRELIDIKSQEEFNKNLEYLRRAERAYQKAMEEAAKTNIHPNSNMMSVSQIAESTKLGMVVNEDRLDLYMPSENGDIIGDGNNGLEKGKRYVLMDGVTPGRKITADMIVNTPVGMLIDMGLDNTEFTDEQGNKRTQQGDARQMFADLMNLCARYKDNNLIWEIAGSEFSEAFSALKSNSDPQYKNTVDFGTICSKTQAIVDVLSQTMVDRVNAIRQWNEEHAAEIEAGTAEKRIFTGLTREDIMEVYNRTHNAGLSVPCPVCYVFSRWMGVPGMLGQMNRFQNEYVVLAKGEDGKTLYDENGDAVVDWDQTFEKANSYLLDMVHEYTKTKDNPNGIDITDPNLTLEERNAAIKTAKDKIAEQKNSINNKIRTRQKSIPKLYEEIGILQEKLEKQDLTDKQRQKIEEQIKKKEETAKKKDREIDQFEEDKKKFEAFNWVSQVLCLQHTEGKATINDLDGNGNFVMDKENFRYTPEEILFDLNRSGEFAGYAKNWRYRTTRGAGMGKAIMPYSGASIGDIIHGEALRWKDGQNPLLNMDRAAAEKAFKSAQKRVKQQNLVGGQRFQSTSDFRPEWGLDYIMSFLEMQALGSKVQMYTKVAEAVDFLGSIGADVNLSIMAKNNGYHIATDEEIALSQQDTKEGKELKSRMGIAQDENGETHLYVMEFSDVTGMDYATAKEKSKKFNNVQMILVGMNDVHIRLALGNQDIDFVIPWHSSGNSKDVLQQLVSSVGEQLLESSDYTDTQTDQIKSHKEGKGKNEKTIDDRTQDEIKLWDARVKLLTEGGEALTQEERQTLMSNDITRELYRRFTEQGYDPDCYGVTLTKDQAEQVFPYEYWDKTSTRENADVNGQRFVEYCDALGLVPRFSQFKDVPGYWKLLIDRKMYDNNVLNDDGSVKEYGKYRDQKVVDVTKARMDNDPNQALDPATDRKKQVYQLPESTTAKYGRKQYKQETENAIRAANEYLSEKYDGHTMNSMYGDLTEADRDLMTDAANDYEDAVARQDWKAAQEDVDFYAEQAFADSKVRDLDGNLLKVYHGTNADFNEFRRDMIGSTGRFEGSGFNFTPYEGRASSYGKNVLAGYLDIKKPLSAEEKTISIAKLAQIIREADPTGDNIISDYARETRDYGKASFVQREAMTAARSVWESSENDVDIYSFISAADSDAEGLIKAFESLGYDGLIHYNDDGTIKTAVAFSSKQFKRADPVTYDNGKPIPLDQRFSDSPDTRYSAEGELTEADRDLMYEDNRNAIYIPNGKMKYTGEEVDFINLILDGKKLGETRTHNRLTTRQWVGLAKDGYVYGRVKLGKPYEITKDSPEYKASYIEGVKDYDIEDGGSKWYYPIEAMEDFRDNPQPILQNGNYGKYSEEGELTDADRDLMEEQKLNQTLVESGALTAEEIAAYEERYHKRPLEGRRATEGNAQRAFGDVGGMLEKSDEIANFAKSVVKAQNTYFPDTNFAQINRAVDWIKSQKGGYAEALDKVTSNSFDYRSADGQARMVAMMGLAAAKNDVIAQASLADAFNRQGTDLGRALQARKLFMLMTPEGRKSTLRKMLQNAKDEMGKQGKNVDLTFSDWIYEAAAAAETQEDMRLVQQAAMASLGEQLPSNWKDRLNSFRMLSMLANPRTHIRNIIGNAMFIPAVSLKNKLGAVMELGVKKGEKTKTLKPVASKEARAFAREDAESIKGLLTGEAKYSEGAKIKQNQAPLGQFMKALSDMNSNFLEGEDWFFLKGHYRRALSGWMEANGYTADQLREDQALLEKGRQYAISEAQKATYRDFSKTAQILNNVSRKGGLPGFIVDAALPFKKTPANILRRGIEYSPAGIVKSLSYDLYRMKQYLDYQNGKLDVLPEKAMSPTQVIDHICAGLSGTAITALGFLLAGSGAVSTGLDDDEDKFEKAKGNQEYALNPGKALNTLLGAKIFGEDVTFTLDWAAPMSMPFFVGAAVREQMEKEGNVNVEDAFNAFGGILEPVFNLSMLDGINTLFKTSSYDSNTNPIMQIFEKIGINYVSSFVPSALGAVARTIDDTRRKSFVPSDQSKGFVGNLRYAHENAQNKIPFYNQENIPVRDIWGNEDTTGLVERILENFILPGYINEYKDDPIINEMARLYEATGDKAMIPEADPDKTISYTVKSTKENVKHVLSDKEWDKYKEVRNKTAFTELSELIENPDYQNASDATQIQMIKDIWNHANKVGQKAVIPEIDLDEPKDNTVATIAKDSKIASTKNEMIKALNAGDYDAFDTMVQALYDEGLEESDVRAKIRDYYREQYKDAYRKNMKDRITEIEEILDNTGIDFDDLIDGWKEAVDEEKSNSASAQPARYIASAGISDSSFSNRTASMPERPASDNGWDQYMSDLDDYWADYDFASNDPVGQYGQGNIDLDNRQTVQNDDGSISTEQSFSFYDDRTGKEVLIPLVVDGRVLTEQEAIDRYYETGEYLGMFDDWHDADEYATMLHNRQDWYYHQ